MVVLDTDLLTLLQRQTGEAFTRLDARLAAAMSMHQVCLNIVSIEKQCRGWLAYIASARDMKRQIDGYRRFRELLRFFEGRHILDFDEGAAQHFHELRRIKVRIGTMDLRIAAIALANQAVLLTRNVSDFQKVPGLQVEDWTGP